jgi:uncharacterized membrane protein HdeD (DUF308 family)
MIEKEIKKIAKGAWWIAVVGGILSIVFGVTALVWPGLTLGVLIHLLGFFVVIIGAIGIVKSFWGISRDPLWWLSLLFSLINLGIGIFLICNPGMTWMVFMTLLIILIFAQSLSDLIIASYTQAKDGKWLWVISGLLGLVFGVIIMFYPDGAALAFIWALGAYAIIRGIVVEVYAFQICGSMKEAKKVSRGKKK